MNEKAHLILAKGHVEERNPCSVVFGVKTILVHRLHDEVECLGEPKEEDDVDDREGEHVSSDHGEDHGDERPCQFDRPEASLSSGGQLPDRFYIPCKEEEVEPTSRDSKDQEGFLDHPIILGAGYLFRIILPLNLIDRAHIRPYVCFIKNQYFLSLKK